MIYLNEGGLVIRDMIASDGPALAEAGIAQGWQSTLEKHRMRLEHQQAGRCVSLVAELQGQPVGYVNVYPDSPWGAFGGRGLPEIVDFNVLEKYRRQGIGGRLMDAAEAVAANWSDTVYLGVGLHSGYGSAQRMYVRRGYIPDGSGVWFEDKVCEPYAPCVNDDSQILYFSKQLR